MKVLDNFCDLIVDTITVCSIGVLIFQIDPIFVLLAVLPFIGTLLLGGKYNDLKYKQDMKNQEISREKDYVQRVFYLSDYAKELRLTQMYQVMLQKMKQSIAGLKETVSQYGFSIMTLEYILALLYEVGVYFVFDSGCGLPDTGFQNDAAGGLLCGYQFSDKHRISGR